MSRKLTGCIVLFLALILAISSAVAADPASLLTPATLKSVYNDFLKQVVYQITGDDTSAAEGLLSALSLVETEIENGIVYYDSSDWNVELSFYYNDQGVKAGETNCATTVNFVVKDELDPSMAKFARLVYLNIVAELMAPDEYDQILSWGDEEKEGVSNYQLDGYLLTDMKLDGASYLALLPDTTQNQTEDDHSLISFNGVSVTLKSVEPMSYSDGRVSLRFYCDVKNMSNSMNVNLFVYNPMLNGVEVDGVGIMKIVPGTEKEDYFFLQPLKEPEQAVDAGKQAIRTPRKLTAELALFDSNSFSELITKEIEIDLTQYVPESKYIADPESSKSQKAEQTKQPKATPVPVSDIFPVVIPENAEGEWEIVDDSVRIRVEVTNVSKVPVTAFSVRMYGLDEDFREVTDVEQTVAYSSVRIRPGESGFSEELSMPYNKKIRYICLGLERAADENQHVYEADDIEYFIWDIY